MTRINVRNLAGVPSIVYGLLGLAIFVKALGGGHRRQDDLRRRADAGGAGAADRDHHGVRGAAGSAAQHPRRRARRRRDRSGRPCAARAAVGGARHPHRHGAVARPRGRRSRTDPPRRCGDRSARTGDQNFFEQLAGAFTAMPAVIFSYARQPGEDFRAITAAASLVLLVLVLVMNAFAIWLRNRYERKW